MAKCIDCGTITLNEVWEPNIMKKIPLCNYCKDSFYRKCKCCEQYYPIKEMNLVTLLCTSCQSNKNP